MSRTAMATKTIVPATLTDEEFFEIDVPGCKVEDGTDEELVLSPAGHPHELVISALQGRLVNHVEDHHLGVVIGSNAVWRLAPGGRRLMPDISFVSSANFDRYQRSRNGNIVEMPPDLVVEVLSPSDKRQGQGLKEHIRGKIDQYRRHLVPLLWVLDDLEPIATTYSHGREGTPLKGDDRLDGGDVVKGFSVVLADLYRQVRELYPLSAK